MNKHPLVALILKEVPQKPAHLDTMRAYDNGVRHAAEILEKTVDSKSFGWVIRRAYDERGEKKYQYLSQVYFADEEKPTSFSWANSQHNATLLPVEFKDAIMSKLIEDTPTARYEAVELFAA
jgi:hypothetical protein